MMTVLLTGCSKQDQQAQQQGDGQAGKRDGGGRAQQGEQQRFAAKDAANLPAGDCATAFA